MAILELTGRITEEGRLEVELPPGLPPGKARVTLQTVAEGTQAASEVGAALTIEPLTGAEIVAMGLLGGWAEEGITDGQEWVEARRRERRERRQW